MRYRSSILEEENYVSSNCLGNCESCAVAQRCFELDCELQAEDVIEDM